MRRILIGFFLAGIWTSGLQAQSLHVHEIVGTQSTYALSGISKLSFSSGNLIISRADSSSISYALDSVLFLNFSDSTTVNIEQEGHVNAVVIYPNPAVEVVNIDYSGASSPGGTISILSIEGSLLMTEQLSGLGTISIPIGHLPRGTYVCLYRNEEILQAIKLIKL